MELLADILQILILVVILVYAAFLVETAQSSKKDRVLYHGSNVREQGELLLQIIKKYIGGADEVAKYSLYEPGAGMGIIAYYLAKHLTWKKVVAIEIGPVIYLLGRIRYAFAKTLTPVTWKLENLFESSYQSPGLVYCYLFPQLITKLYTEGKLAGNVVVSLTFPIENLEPTEVIQLKSWQSKLFIYDLRQHTAKGGDKGKH